MRRWLPGAAAAVTAVAAFALVTGVARTAATSVPASLAGYSTVVVTGAPLSSVAHTVSGTTITGSDIYLAGNFKHSTVRERFGTGATVTCDFVNDAGRNLSHFYCTGLSQSTLASSTLTITVT